MVARANKKRRRSRGLDEVSLLPVPVLWFEALFEHLCFALVSLATTCVVVELLFS
jgi:hypothetical protein